MTKALPTALLRSTCSEASKTIVNVLEFALKSEEQNVALIKSLLYCLGSLLRAQSIDVWSTESIRHLFRILLRFACHEKPAWRKACHESILSIVNANLENSLVSTHPASHQAAEFILNIITEEHNSLCSFVKIRDTDCTRLLQALHLISGVAISLTKADLKKCCEVLLELTRFPNSSVAEKCFESIGKIFENHPNNESMPQELSGRIVTAMYSSKPAEPTVLEIGSTNLLQAWFSSIFSACAHLSYCAKTFRKEDEKRIANQHLDRFIRLLFESILDSSLAKMRQFCAVLLDRCLTDLLYSHIEELEFMAHCPQLLPHLAQQFRDSLVLRYRDSWLLTIPIFARLCRIWPRSENAELPPSLAENLRNIAQLRDSLADGSCPLLDSHSSTEAKNALVDEFDRACIAAINTWGPELILRDVISIEPLLVELEELKSLHLLRSWILPLVMRSVPMHSCDISFFTDYILSLADRAVAVTKKLAAGQGFVSKLPTASVPKSWEPISKTLGNRLAEEVINTPILREAILKSLRALCEVAADQEAGLKVMRGGARVIIPRLLTIYEDCDPESQCDLKQKLRSTLLAYFSILPPKIVNNPCEIAIKKYEETEKYSPFFAL
ncbi:pre-rRNA processing protein [Cichlidogyrus casuarinus]|uniref:Pre-rRNA processing protein n=1 Tax=Cichlidogyrus casuarinus TaxID=1844966 RepID=A0ABD2QKK6_9PLAT